MQATDQIFELFEKVFEIIFSLPYMDLAAKCTHMSAKKPSIGSEVFNIVI